MTQTTSKLAKATSAALLTSLLVPMLAFAQTGEAPRRLDSARDRMQNKIASSTAQSAGGPNFCTNIDSLVSKLDDAERNLEGKRKEFRKNATSSIQERRGEKTEKLEDRRDDHSANRDQRYVKMTERATTTEQKAAVDAFKASVEAAVTKRQAAVDSAIATYRSAVDALISGRKTAVDTAGTTHKTAVDAAIAKAKADCAAGIASPTVRTTLRETIKAANEAFKTSAKRPEDLKNQVKALRDARDASIKSAIENFKTEYEAAKAALKTALGK